MSRIVCACVAALLTAVPSGAAAHETRPAGPVELVVGWASEPAFAGFLNAVELRVTRDETPVEGLAETMKVEVRYADGAQRTGPLDLRPVFDSPGQYRADLLPTAPGSYSFHFTGTIEGRAVDETFESGDETFDEVRSATAVEFPDKAPSRAELAQAIERLEPRVAGAEQTPGPSPLTYVALGLSVVALVLSVFRRKA